MSSVNFPFGNLFLPPVRTHPAGDAVGDRPLPPVGGSSLAGLLSPLRARLRPVPHGHELTIQPMRPVDALGPFLAPAARADSDDRTPPAASTLLLGVRPAASPLPTIESGVEPLGPGRLVVSDAALPGLIAGGVPFDTAVRIEGPIEVSDAVWIQRGLDRGGHPLASEVRAIRSMQVGPNRTLLVHARHVRDAAAFAAEPIRHFLAAVAGLPLADVPPPDVGLLLPMFEVGGEFTIRPIETDVYSTSVDVGIATNPPESPRPADASLIYDLLGASWHGE